MSEDQGGEATTVDTEAQAAVEAAVSSQEPENTASERDYEAEAREMGWRPKDEWTGKPENWKDAETYVDHGDHISRLVEARLAKIKKDTDDRLEKIERVNVKAIANLKAQHAKELGELKAAKKEAVKAGDVDEVERIDEEIEKHKEAGPDKEPVEDRDAVQEAWVAKQKWWGVDDELTEAAIGISNGIAMKNPTISMAENIRRTEEKLKTKYPEKFGVSTPKKSGANGHAPVDGGGALNGGALPKSPLNGIPQADLAVGLRHVKEGLFKNIEAWAKEYHNA